MASKLFICIVLAALVACAMAQLVPIAGTRDLTGGYYDHYSGQYSSAITGRVYNTAPGVVAAPAVVHAPAVIAHPAHVAHVAHIAHPAIAAAPVAWIRR